MRGGEGGGFVVCDQCNSYTQGFDAFTPQRGLPILVKSLQVIAGLLGKAVGSFAYAVLAIELLVGLTMAGLSFWLAYDGSLVRGILATVLAILFITVLAVVVGVYYAAISTARRAVADAGLGKTVCDELFDRVLGVRGDDAGEQPDTAQIPTHMSAKEVKTALNGAARKLLSDKPLSNQLTAPLFWLANRFKKCACGRL